MSHSRKELSNRGLGKSALLFSVDSVSALLFSFLSLALVAQKYGPEMYGLYSVAQSVSTLFVVMVTFGLEPFIIREVARGSGTTRLMLPVVVVMSIGWALYSALVVCFYLLEGSLHESWIVLACVVATTFFVKVPYLRLHLQATGNGLPLAVAAVISRLVAAIYLIYMVWRGSSFELALFYLPIQAATGALVMYLMQRNALQSQREPASDWSRIRGLLKEAFPYFVSTAIFYGYTQADIIILSLYESKSTVGIYASAAKLIPLVSFVSFALVAAYYPSLDAALKMGEEAFWEKVREVSNLIVTVALIGVLLAWITAGPILKLLYGDKFLGADTYFRVLAIGWIFSLPAALYSRVVVMLGESKVELYKMLSVGPLFLAISWALIKQFGAIGGATTVVLSYAVVDLGVYFLFPQTRRLGSVAFSVLHSVALNPLKGIKESLNSLLSKSR